MSQLIDIAKIKREEIAQPRAYTSDPAVLRYAERMAAGDSFPPIIVFFDGQWYWLADGFHRTEAACELGLAEIAADVRPGTLRDAILYSCSANAVHGMMRTPEDMHRAVDRLLADPEWLHWSDSRIGDWCRVTHDMVGRRRAKMYPDQAGSSEEQVRTVQRGDSTYTMRTGHIGTSRRPGADHDPLAGGAGKDRPASTYDPAPPTQPRPAGYREAAMRNPTLQIEGTLLAIRNAMSALPSPTVTATAVPHFDMDEAERFSLWWTDFSEELRDRAERAA